MKKEILLKKRSKDGADVAGPYTTVVKHGNTLYIAGQAPLDLKTCEIVGETIEEQTAATLDGLKTVLEDVGSSLEHVLNMTVYLTDMSEWERMNKVYAQYFPENFPARTAVGAGQLWEGIKIEVQAIACLPD